jgi:hypothetical protein
MPVTIWIFKFNSAERLEYQATVFSASLVLTCQQSLGRDASPMIGENLPRSAGKKQHCLSLNCCQD